MFEIPKIKEVLPLRDYAPEFGDAHLDVWINPPAKLLNQMDSIVRAIANGESPDNLAEAVEVVAQLWHSAPADVEKLIEHSQDTDPGLFKWLLVQTFAMIRDHRWAVKKNWKLQS